MKRRIQDRQSTDEKKMEWQRGGATAGREGVANVADLQARIAQKDQALHQAKTDLAEMRQELEKIKEEAEQKLEALRAELDELVQEVAAKEVEVVELTKQATSVTIKDGEIKELLEIISSNEEEIERLKDRGVEVVEVKTAEIKSLKKVTEQGDDTYLLEFTGTEEDIQITSTWQAIRKAFQKTKVIRKKDA
jgi:chromosome segregation ATPase